RAAAGATVIVACADVTGLDAVGAAERASLVGAALARAAIPAVHARIACGFARRVQRDAAAIGARAAAALRIRRTTSGVRHAGLFGAFAIAATLEAAAI